MAQFPQVDRRLTPRTIVDNRISISVKHTTPAFHDKTEQEEYTNRCMARVYDISDKGMCITTKFPLDSYYFVEISVIQDSQYPTKDKYSGVITWCLYNKDRNSYRYGIEFLSSWIRRKLYRRQKKYESSI
mgnify:CR=1 FL=1